MHKKLILSSFISLALMGCNSDEDVTIKPPPPEVIPPTDILPPEPPEVIPPTDILPPLPPTDIVPPTDIIPIAKYKGTLYASGKILSGDVICGDDILTDDIFIASQGNTVSCYFGSIHLGDFEIPFPETQEKQSDLIPISFDLRDLHGENAAKLLQSISLCQQNNEKICLNELNSFDIEEIFKQVENDQAVEDYFKKEDEKSTDEVDKSPSSHVDKEQVPVVSQGTSNDLNSNFVSANAENSYEYKPSSDAKVLTLGHLTDATGKPLSGINFYSKHSTGITNDSGEFEYLWGDTITFSIDTFEFGSVKGNQIDYKLTDVTDNLLTKNNIQSLLDRYGSNTGYKLEISDNVRNVFNKYPNVINQLINLNLPNGSKIEGSDFFLPNEFEQQFSNGLTADIDNALVQNKPSTFFVKQKTLKFDNGTYVTDSLNEIFKNVTSFHVFNDNSSFYGATGYTRGMRALNLSNRAFPVVMARSDINKEIPFGEKQAWTRDGKPYIAEYKDIQMPQIPVVSKDTATFGFPFVTAGEIGSGRIVFMGNSMYPSILSCPDNYWANDYLQIDDVNQTCSSNLENDVRDDHGSMKKFFNNLFTWFVPERETESISVATNIETGIAARSNWTNGRQYKFFINKLFNFSNVEFIGKDGFSGISPTDTPLLILQAYKTRILGDGQTHRLIADLDNPLLSNDDITALVKYVNDGGNILFMDAIDTATNPEPIGRLADAAGVSLGGYNVTPTNQAFCGSSYYCQSMYPNLHVKSQYDMVVLERFPDVNGKPPFSVNQDGSINWNPPADMPNLEIPTYEIQKLDSDGSPMFDDQNNPIMINKHARIFVKNEEERLKAISELQTAFPNTPLCTNEYEYEINCIEERSGDGIVVRGNYWRADFDRYPISPDVVTSMIKAANLGDNIQALSDHEIYYRTHGKLGKRLSSNELNQTFDNLSVWLWNNNDYSYDKSVQDELGFKTLVEYLNCYTNDQHGNGATCPAELKNLLVQNNMIYGSDSEFSGQMNPSYPLNYKEKPLTRIMLGRSFWDYDIVVDVTKYPGRALDSTTETVDIITTGNGVTFSAGNNQSTGLWIPQLKTVVVSGGVRAKLTVMFADDLTGKPQHETNLNRPPRMQMSFNHDGSATEVKVPYGGLLYIQPLENNGGNASFSVSGAAKAALWKNGSWINNPNSVSAPIAEIDTGTFIYTTPLNTVKSLDVQTFSDNMNRFANAASDFYGRDESIENGSHRRFTYDALEGFRHRFVNDVQISIGAAHSGYPVMSSSFNANANQPSTNAVDDWLLWHEVGHNLASAPFNVTGGTEVTNNILALYMQELKGRNENPQMDRIRADIQKAPYWLSNNSGHAWSNGDAGMRLVMFGQLKLWAKDHFNIDNWYNENKPNIYSEDQGWNMIKLMHRKARGDVIGDKGLNYCSSKDTGLYNGDLLMVCSSYVSGYDLSDFFRKWNPSESSSTNTDGSKTYTGGISNMGYNVLASLNLSKPAISPESINHL